MLKKTKDLLIKSRMAKHRSGHSMKNSESVDLRKKKKDINRHILSLTGENTHKNTLAHFASDLYTNILIITQTSAT